MKKESSDFFFYLQKELIAPTRDLIYNAALLQTARQKESFAIALAMSELLSNTLKYEYGGAGLIYIKLTTRSDLIALSIIDFNESPHYEAYQKGTGYKLIDELVDSVEMDENYAFGKKITITKRLNPAEPMLKYVDETFDVSQNYNEKITGFPSLSYMLSSLKMNYVKNKKLYFVFISLQGLFSFESYLGYKAFDLIIKAISFALRALQARKVFGEWIITPTAEYSDNFLIFFPEAGHSHINSRKIASLIKTIKIEIISALSYFIEEQLIEKFDIYTEFCEITYESNVRFERILWHKINEEIKNSMINEDAVQKLMKRELLNIIEHKRITSFFQGIYSAGGSEKMAYEVLARGPKGSILFFPEVLFSTAYKSKKVPELELVAFSAHINKFKELGEKDKILFINLEPLAIMERIANIEKILLSSGLNLENIVIELTERTLISDIAKFKGKLRRLKDIGVKIAIDDVGSGYSNLLMLAELMPDILKFDINMLKTVHNYKFRNKLIDTIQNFAVSLNAKIVAEGIESPKDIELLKNYKIDYYQGFYFERPREL